MPNFRRFWAWLKGADPRQVYGETASIAGVVQPPLSPPVDAQPLAETEQQHPTIGRAVDVISRDAASVKVVLNRVKDEGKTREPIASHPALDVLNWINAVDTPNIWWQSVYADLLTYGDHFSWVQVDGDGVHNILRLPARSMVPIPHATKIISHYEWTDDQGHVETYNADEIIHLKTRNPNSIYRGMSLLERLRGTIVLDRAQRRWNQSRFDNNISSTLIIKTKKVISKESEMMRLMDHVQNKMAGPENAGRPFIINSDETEIDYLPRPTEEELAFLEGLKLNRTEIATVFGVPPSELMDFSDAFRSNAKEQGRAYWEATIMGWHRLVSEWLNTVWLPRFWPNDTDLEFSFDYSDVRALGFSAFEMAQVNEILVRAGIRTPNEARHSMGDDASKDEAANGLYVNGRALGADPFSGMPGLGDTATPMEEPAVSDTEEHQDDAKVLELLRPVTLKDIDQGSLIDLAEEERILEARVRAVIAEMVRVAGEQQIVADGVVGVFNVADPAVLAAVADQSIALTGNVTRSTVAAVRQAIAENIASGVPTDSRIVREVIQEAFVERKQAWQLKRISRTEVHQAQESGSYHAAVQNGIEFKRWLSARDSHVRGPGSLESPDKRSDHAAMDNQVVPIEAKFLDPISRAHLLYPGDVNGATGGHDIINCRCTWVSEFEGQGPVKRFVDYDSAWMKKNETRADFEKAMVALLVEHLAEMEGRALARLSQAAREVA